MQVYLNGKFVPYEQAVVPVEDRGFVFADGVYEVVRFYRGKALGLDMHMARLAQSAAAIRLPALDLPALTAAALETVARNNLSDATLYMQVTRGVAPRNHAFPPATQPTVFMIARPCARPDQEVVRKGVACITVPDLRMTLTGVKSIALLPSVLAKQQAVETGAFEALFVRDGVVSEGASSNFWAVVDGTVFTHPDDAGILSGITRKMILRMAQERQIPVREEPITEATLATATEAFLTSTTIEVMPVTAINGQAVGTGKPGPITMLLWEAYDQAVQAL